MVEFTVAKVRKSPAAKGTVIYSEDPIEVLLVRTLGRFLPKRWFHPLYREIHTITSFKNLLKAAGHDPEAYERLENRGKSKLTAS